MTKENLRMIRDYLLKECKKEIAEYVMPYCDGVLDLYNEVVKLVEVDENS